MLFNKNFVLVSVILSMVLLIPSEGVFAEEQETVEVEIKYTNGDRAGFNGMKMLVYQDFDKAIIIEKDFESNPDFITVDKNHRYKIEVFVNGIYADVGYVQLGNNSEKLDITIPLSGGIQFEVYYEDGKTPIKDATVILKSSDYSELGRGLTNDQGETTRYWIQSTTRQDDHYIVDVYLEDLFLTSFSPLKILAGTSNDQKIVTNIPEIVDELITINLYENSEKITSSDGNYKVILSDLKKTKNIESNLNFRGDAQFSNLNSGSYLLKISSDTVEENIQWSETIIHVVGNSNEFSIFKDTGNNIDNENPFQSCNCVAFRLDDVQDYWLSDTQIEIINLFNEKNIPLSVGVIGSMIGDDDKITSTLIENLEKNNIEIVNHSWDNDVLIGIDKEIQKEKIIKTNDRIFEVFGVSPTSFIPPQNLYDRNSILVLLETGFSHLVAHIDENIETFSINDKFYNVPAITETARLIDDNTPWELNDKNHIKEKTIESIHDNGYAIIMLHPQEFALDDNGEYGPPNQKTLSELSLLLDEISQLDVDLVKISEVKPVKLIIDDDSQVPIIEEENMMDSCNCVAFRLDDVQDYWLNDVQIKIMETFSKTNTPLTVGILANAFGNDQKITDFVKENMIENGGNIEVATKGIGLTPFTNYNKIEQSENLKESLDKIQTHLDMRPKIFIPPDNKFNTDTMEILEENMITHISSSLINGDAPPFEFRNQEVYRFPLITSTGEYNPTKNIFEGIPSTKTLSESIQGNSNYGYSVISLHPQEYSIIQNSTYTNSINEKQIDELIQLIDELANQGYKIVPIGKINSNLIVLVPEWIKNNAGWWADGSIDDKTFVQGIEYLVQEDIIRISERNEASNDQQEVPEWIKNNAGWWADGSIDDKTFVQGIEYLVKSGIIAY